MIKNLFIFFNIFFFRLNNIFIKDSKIIYLIDLESWGYGGCFIFFEKVKL